jgi:signal transduction histidine kinase
VKEILNNIVKHSRATEVFFNLKLNARSATLEIRDNGAGFNPAALDLPAGLNHSNGNGLGNLEKRALAIGGHCLIQSEPGVGTKIALTVPGPHKSEHRQTGKNKFR